MVASACAVEHVAQCAGDRLRLEGGAQHPLDSNAAQAGQVSPGSADEEHGEVGPRGAQDRGQLQPAHARKALTRDHRVDGRAPREQGAQGALGVGLDEHLVAVGAEQVRGQVPRAQRVVDPEQALFAPQARRLRQLADLREPSRGAGAAPQLAGQLEAASGLVAEALDQGQTEPRAGPGGLGREEGVARALGRRDRPWGDLTR